LWIWLHRPLGVLQPRARTSPQLIDTCTPDSYYACTDLLYQCYDLHTKVAPHRWKSFPSKVPAWIASFISSIRPHACTPPTCSSLYTHLNRLPSHSPRIIDVPRCTQLILSGAVNTTNISPHNSELLVLIETCSSVSFPYNNIFIHL
jgi:hypothetical protein